MSTPAAAGDIVQEITIDAPVSRVFDAFTNPSERVKWWSAPDGRFRTTHMESDLRVGGKWAMGGTRGDGAPFTVTGTYRVVERPTVVEFTWLPSWLGEPLESVVRVEFTNANGKTHVRLTHSGLTTDASRSSHKGWPGILAWLRTYAESV